jgi:glycosyltransferase involved in cell wall biosynthesis
LDYGVPKHKIKTIYSGLDLAQFNNIKSTFTNPPLVGLISRLSAEKEVEIFIKSIPEILQVFPDTKFEIIGDGPEKEKLQNLSASLGLTSKLSFRGWCQNIADVLPSLDIFVFTSGGEGLPWCILEAQACGVPLIASSVGGIPEIIKAGTNGLLAESNTPECFASGIMSLLKNPDNAMKMAKNGRDKVESHFNIQREVTEIGNLYQKLVSEIS